MARSIRWLDRSLAVLPPTPASPHPTTSSTISSASSIKAYQSLFPIIQGGLDLKLREECVKAMVERNANGYAIGGLSGGESKDVFWRVVSKCTDLLPPDKPRYCMGVGYVTFR